jgi:hypothetical protein
VCLFFSPCFCRWFSKWWQLLTIDVRFVKPFYIFSQTDATISNITLVCHICIVYIFFLIHDAHNYRVWVLSMCFRGLIFNPTVPIKLAVLVCMREVTWEPPDRLSWTLVLDKFMKPCQAASVFSCSRQFDNHFTWKCACCNMLEKKVSNKSFREK